MTADQKLDPEAEARIREACVNLRGGSDSDRSGDEWHNPEPYDFDAPNATCLCRDLRAAILADREAREKYLSGVLCRVAQLLDGWHQDGTAWTEYDESVRREVADLRRTLK